MFSDNGYTLELATSEATVGNHVPLQFRILDPVGTPLIRYTDTHDKQLHLIVVGLDLTGFQHVHPELDENGNWHVSVDFDHAGDYRVFADFTPDGGDGITLSADVRVAGPYDPRPLPAAAAATTVDGYTVSLEGAAHAGQTSKLTLSVSRDGIPVTDLQPYLAAYGHLVALRAPTSPISMSIRTATPVTVSRRLDRQSPSTPTCRAPRITGCFWTSSTAEWCVRRNSR